MSQDRLMQPLQRAEVVAWLYSAKDAIEQALRASEGDEMYKEQKNRCMASIESARSKLAYAWNALAPFIEP